MIVALNPQHLSGKFQCQNFFLNRTTRPFALVPDDCNKLAIFKALADGILLDVTDSQKRIEHDGQSLSPVDSQDTPKRAFMSPEGTIVIPKDEAELQELESKATLIARPPQNLRL